MRKEFLITFFVFVLFAAMVPAMPVKATPDPGLVGLWHFDEGEGQTASDSSGFANHGRLGFSVGIDVYDPTWVAGICDHALSFDGNDYVYVPDSGSLDITRATLEAWIKPSVTTQSGYARIIFKGTNSPFKPLYLLAYDGSGVKMRMGVWIGEVGKIAMSTTSLTNTAKWYHIVGTYDGSAVRIYIDGVLEATTSVPSDGDIDIGPQNLGIGRNSEANLYGYKGIIDEVHIWNEALTVADLEIVKSGPTHAYVGDSILYTYTVTNTGPDSASGVEVNDDLAGPAVLESGDDNGNGKLDPDETWIFTVTYTVTGTDPDPLENIATVTSDARDPDTKNNEASWSVDLLNELRGSIYFDAVPVLVEGIEFQVDVYDVNGLQYWMKTTTGTYSFPNVAAGDYSVELVAPSGWIAMDSPQPVTFTAGVAATKTVNFHVDTVVTTVDIRSMGFWKHQYAVANGGKGKAQYTFADLGVFLNKIGTYWPSDWTKPSGSPLSVADAYAILNPSEPASMEDRAKQQLLALMLNVVSGKIGTGNVVDLSSFGLDTMNVGQAIQYCLTNLTTNPELVKDIADAINNGLVFV